MNKCNFCGKHTTNKSFCSRSCIYKWQSENWSGTDICVNSNHAKINSFVCPTCEEMFERKTFNSTETKKCFCSPKCRKPFLGKKHSEKSIEKIREASIKQKKRGLITEDTKPERMVENYLLFNNILYVKQFKYKYGIADFWLPEDNIIIEVLGNYWHSLPEKIEKDKKKISYLKNKGFDVIVMWESDIKNKGCGALLWN